MIVFSDMDGTFLTPTKRMSTASRAALDELAARGWEFVPCTGRALAGIPAEVLAHPAVHYAVGANGATVAQLDPVRKTAEAARILRSAPLDRDRALAVLEVARDYDVTFDLFADGTCYLQRAMHDRLDEFVADRFILRSMKDTRIPVDEDPADTIARVDTLERVAMYWKDERDRDAILERLRALPGISITRSYPMNIEVMNAGVSKGSAMAWLCAHLGVDLADAVAFGDNFNDIEMIEMAGTGVAVANAEFEVLDAANRICPPNDESGVARFIATLL